MEARPYTYDTLKGAITAHFEPDVNLDYERYLLRQARQTSDESVDIFYERLKELASTCTLPDEEDEIMVQFIQGCSSSKLRDRILQQPNMLMRDILTLGWFQELSKACAALMEQEPTVQVKAEPVNAVTASTPWTKAEGCKGKQKDRPCRWCGGPTPHPGSCPARGKTCSACGKVNHFVKVCRSVPRTAAPTPKRMVRALDATPSPASDSDMDDDHQVVHFYNDILPAVHAMGRCRVSYVPAIHEYHALNSCLTRVL
ncbi:hypothetical protein NDU88_003418 [Pleurodeles waltl]|uniref:Retrotransposon gag domain-containing protein n=1 Tax=Pleurodeles waltl TaxID=8319 RepID=A0AAV7V2E4_PLEWA|nr:hypothetical protein NDU88_003418 [Pleurodeles waltl]